MIQKPLILTVETSSRMGSVGLALGEKMLAETAFSGPARHSSELFPSIQQLLNKFDQKPSDIEQVYISIRPGSFTGLRIATTLAKMMHLANAAKIVTVDTLDCIAANVTDISIFDTRSSPQDAFRQSLVAPVLDAKRNQFFIAVYELNSDTSKKPQATRHGTWQKILPDVLISAPEFIERFAGGDKPVWLLGDGLLYHKDKFKSENIKFLDQKYWSPKAGKVHSLGWQKALAGQFADPLTLVPNYIRLPEPEEKFQQRTP
jgi:tRNA threonylcarbamoyladenosine biosynthesis protein TsaB